MADGNAPRHWNQGSFGSGVKIGNWNEDKFLKEEEMSDFLIQHTEGELGFHKTDALIRAATAPAALSGAKAGAVSFGDRIMLEHKAGVATLASLPSVHVGVHEVVGDKMMVAGSGMGSNDDHVPVTRNVFTVEPFTAGQAGPLNFGDKFCLRLDHPTEEGTTLYLGSDTQHMSSETSRYSGEQVVDLRSSRDEAVGSYGCAWTVNLQDPDFRLESEGTPVPANTEVVVRHVQTSKLLACNHMIRKRMQSEFGAEYEITCATKMTRAKVEAPENHWAFKMA